MSASLSKAFATSSRPRASANTDRGWVGYSLVAPGILALLVLFIGPVLAVFAIALTDWELGAGHFSWVGLQNFRILAVDPDFRAALINTLVYTLIVVPVTVLLGLVTALLIESGRSLRAFYRAAHFVPFMATMAAMAIAWEAMLHPTMGLVNHLIGWFGLGPENWLRDPHRVLPVLAVIGIWQGFGYAMVLFLAGLKAIPPDLYDAAAIDGADATLDRLRTVILPMLGPTMMFVCIITGLRALEAFDTVRILTQGGPGGSSEVLVHLMYVESFEYLRTGYGAAITVAFLLIIAVLTLIQARSIDRRVHYS